MRVNIDAPVRRLPGLMSRGRRPCGGAAAKYSFVSPRFFVEKKCWAASSPNKETLVPLAAGSHLFPFRTESLSPPALMVLGVYTRESKSVPTQHNLGPCHESDRGLTVSVLYH